MSAMLMDRPGYFFHRLKRRVARSHTFLDVVLDRLYNDDRVVDH